MEIIWTDKHIVIFVNKFRIWRV